MKSTTLLTIITHPEWSKKPSTPEDYLAYLAQIESDERQLDALISTRTATLPAGMPAEHPFYRQKREEKESALIATLQALGRSREDYFDHLRACQDREAISAGMIPGAASLIVVADNDGVGVLTGRLRKVLAAIADTESELQSQFDSFETLRRELQESIGAPDKVTDEQFQLIAGKKLRFGAMIQHMQRLVEKVREGYRNLVPLIQMCLLNRNKLGRLLRLGKAETVAQANKAACLMEARREAFQNTKLSDLLRPSEAVARTVEGTQMLSATFDDLKRAADTFCGELPRLLREIAETKVALGGDIPRPSEFAGRLCPCGCGAENTEFRFWHGTGSTLFSVG